MIPLTISTAGICQGNRSVSQELIVGDYQVGINSKGAVTEPKTKSESNRTIDVKTKTPKDVLQAAIISSNGDCVFEAKDSKGKTISKLEISGKSVYCWSIGCGHAHPFGGKNPAKIVVKDNKKTDVNVTLLYKEHKAPPKKKTTKPKKK